MLAAADVPIGRIEAAAPLVSGFLGGYVAALPLMGAYSDARGRLPAFAAAAATFAAGSLATGAASSLPWLVAGRALQGLGGGALVPLTWALAADLYPAGNRGPALGAVAAVQEAGSVFGPLYGATVAGLFGSWRSVFWLNLPLAALFLFGLRQARRLQPSPAAASGSVNWAGGALLGSGVALIVAALYPDQPDARPLNVLFWPLASAGAIALAAFAWLERRRIAPLLPRGLLTSRGFAGSVAANVLVGAALIVALVDVPLVARGVYDLDSTSSGLLLSRLLLGVPLGALAGGWLSGRLGGRPVALAGLLLAALAFAAMAGWQVDELSRRGVRSSAELFACGAGFGLVIAPLSAAALDAAAASSHGVTGSVTVLARTLGMVFGLAALTAFGLARFNRIVAERRCGTQGGQSITERIHRFEACARDGLLQEYREIFLIAAGLCLLAALVALVSLGRRQASAVAAPG